MIIDAHSHWLPAEIIAHSHFFSKAWGDIESQLQLMESAGIDQALLTYPTSDAHTRLGGMEKLVKVYNDNVAAVIRRFPDRFIGAAVLPVDDPESMLDECMRATEHLGFRALALASSYEGIYLDDPRFRRLYARAEEKGLPIFVHSQTMNPIGYGRVQDPLLTPVVEYVFDITICIGKLLMSGVFREFCKTTFVFANFGGSTASLAHRFDETYQMLRGINFVEDLGGKPTDYLKKIYVDTGGDRASANFLASLDLFGPDHILWGSDWPAKRDVKGSMQAVRALNLGEQHQTDMMGGTLERLLKGE